MEGLDIETLGRFSNLVTKYIEHLYCNSFDNTSLLNPMENPQIVNLLECCNNITELMISFNLDVTETLIIMGLCFNSLVSSLTEFSPSTMMN